ncbi:MAG: M20 family metallopeptidase [Planctomycetaceae bacterium]
MAGQALEILKDLVSIPSVNPMGRDLTGDIFFEGRLSDYLVGFFENLNVPVERVEVVPGRDNVIARLDVPQAKTTILMDAHQDTVPVDGMVIEPFTPAISNGKLFGRGACDVKGGMAAMLAAFARLVHHSSELTSNIVMSCTCDEEATIQGVNDLVKMWTDPSRKTSLFPKPPDVAVVAEPTDLDVVVAHRGATRWKIRTTGRACHSSRPKEGINAIYRMGKILAEVEKFADELETLVPPHPLCGPATISVGRIEGGVSVNTVPDECSIEIDRRCIPGEDGLAVIDQLKSWLQERIDFEFEFLPPWIVGAALSDDDNGEFADVLLNQIAAVAGPHKKVGVPYGTHASRISAAGVPSVVFGPGSIDQAHTKDEWISIDELEQAAEVYYRFCISLDK